MNIAIHSQGVELTEALCLYISACVQHATGGFAPLVEQTRIDIAMAKQYESVDLVQCRLAITVRPSTTINLAASAPTPCAAIGQATDFLESVMTSPMHSEPVPAVRIPVTMRIPAASLFRRCGRMPR
jgi:ribosome-associated translation inhibitor RaiA